ncbi:hypothetical protein LSAT2_018095, partial [Lamellibrachia satsuma]
GASGQRRFNVTEQQLKTLCELGLKGTEIAQLLGISYTTLKRRF